MTTISNAQFQVLLATIAGAACAQTNTSAVNATKNDPVALGPIRLCALGTDTMKKLTLFKESLEEAENRM